MTDWRLSQATVDFRTADRIAAQEGSEQIRPAARPKRYTVTFSDGRTRTLTHLERLTVALYRQEIVEKFLNGNDAHTDWWNATKREADQTGESVSSIRDGLWSWVGMFYSRISDQVAA